MNKLQALAVLAVAAAFGSPAAASDDCSAVKKAIEAKMTANGVKDVTLTVVDKDVKVPGKIVGRCDRKKRKIIYAAKGVESEMVDAPGGHATSPADAHSPDARIAMTSRGTVTARTAVDAKAAAAAKAASEAATAEARAASAASLAAEAKAAANKAAAEARAAAMEARTAAETRAMAAARVAAEAKAQADAAANEATSAADAKVAADTWAATAAKAATDAAAAAAKAAADARSAADIKAAAQARAVAAAQKAAAEARVAATARAAADAIVIDPADAAGVLAAAGTVEANVATRAAPQARAAADVKTIADPRAAAGPQLQYDGVYRAPVSVNGTLSWKYFRFYPDGTFITVRSVGTPEQLRQWFVRDEPNNERGIVKFQGMRLLFFTPEGSPAAYDGSMEAGQVVINTRGRTGQNQHSDIYEFVRWPAGGGIAPAATAQSR